MCATRTLIVEISSRVLESSGSDTKESISQWFNITKVQMTINKIQSGILERKDSCLFSS
jgi:hypothetical protein